MSGETDINKSIVIYIGFVSTCVYFSWQSFDARNKNHYIIEIRHV